MIVAAFAGLLWLASALGWKVETMAITRKGRIIAPTAAHVLISDKCPRAYAVASFDNATAPMAQRAMRAELEAQTPRYVIESVYAGIIGGKRTYDALVYSTLEERGACFALKMSEGE